MAGGTTDAGDRSHAEIRLHPRSPSGTPDAAAEAGDDALGKTSLVALLEVFRLALCLSLL